MSPRTIFQTLMLTTFVVIVSVGFANAEIDQCDFDGDGDVDAADLVVFSEKFGTVRWYKDLDGDGYSDGNTEYSVSQPIHYYMASELTATTGDCDDVNSAVNPGVEEICGDKIDNDCDGTIDCPDCVVEGEIGSAFLPVNCCPGLLPATVSEVLPDNSCMSISDVYVCIQECGDDNCGLGENKCNCPLDCP